MSSSSIFTFMTILAIIFLAQVNRTTSKSVAIEDNNKVRPSLHEIVERNVDMADGRSKKTKYSYYYIGKSVLYFVLYYQLFYNFYFLAHIVRSAFLHRVSPAPGHLQYFRDKVLPPLLGNLVYERWPLHNGRRRGFEASDNTGNNEQLEPTYEINQEGIHNLTMTVLNAIKKFSGDYNNAS